MLAFLLKLLPSLAVTVLVFLVVRSLRKALSPWTGLFAWIACSAVIGLVGGLVVEVFRVEEKAVRQVLMDVLLGLNLGVWAGWNSRGTAPTRNS